MTGHRLLPAILVAVLCASPAYAQLSPKDRETTIIRTQPAPTPPPPPADAATPNDLKAGMTLKGSKGQTLGQIVAVNKNVAGQLTSMVVQTPDGVKHLAPVVGLIVADGAATTTLNWVDIASLPRVS